MSSYTANIFGSGNLNSNLIGWGNDVPLSGSALAFNGSANWAAPSISYAPAALASRSYSVGAPTIISRSIAAAPVATLAHAAPVALAANFSVPDNVDPQPLIVRKKPAAPVNYTQLVSVKFLQPPPPQQPGDIVISQQRDVQAAPVAPRLIRQRPPLPVK